MPAIQKPQARTPQPPADQQTRTVVGRHARAIRILTCLQSGPGFNARELAAYLKVSRRTIYRDLNLIRDAGIALFFDEKHSAYRLSRPTQQHVTPNLEDTDLLMLAFACHVSLLPAIPSLHYQSRESLSKLLCHYPDEIRTGLTRIINSCHVRLPSTDVNMDNASTMTAILRGIAERRQLRLLTTDAYSEIRTKFAPYRLELSLERWCVVGRSSYDRATRSFQLSEIVEAVVTDDTFIPPRGCRFEKAEPSERSWRQLNEPSGRRRRTEQGLRV